METSLASRCQESRFFNRLDNLRWIENQQTHRSWACHRKFCGSFTCWLTNTANTSRLCTSAVTNATANIRCSLVSLSCRGVRGDMLVFFLLPIAHPCQATFCSTPPVHEVDRPDIPKTCELAQTYYCTRISGIVLNVERENPCSL